jgi:P-type Ca2+ transporter type 2C
MDTLYKGLSTVEAAHRLQRDGYNELPSKKRRSLFLIFFTIVSEPMFLLLIAGGTLYFILGSREEACMLFSFVFFVLGITFYQERKTDRALEVLRNLASPRALVIRDQVEKRIAGREVVIGDLVVLREGDCVPADATLVVAENLLVDESLLTGESVAVRKLAQGEKNSIFPSQRPGGDDLPFVYSGTLVVRGSGMAYVNTIGLDTEIGKIGKYLKTIETEKTPLQKEVNKLVRYFAVIGLLLCCVVVIFYGVTRTDWLHGLLAGIALAMAILPEEFPVVLMIFLAIGAWRISTKKVLTRRIPAIEALGSATVLCVDKTGTLTLNRMAVSELYVKDSFYEIPQAASKNHSLPELFHEVVEFSLLASQKDLLDPMEKAIHALGLHYLAHTEHIHKDWTLVRQYPLSKELLTIAQVWKSAKNSDYMIAVKGAPEAIADLCHFDQVHSTRLLEKVRIMASKGLRVLGIAKACFKKTVLPEQQHDFSFQFLGLIGLSDPIRPQVAESIQDCYTAGIRVIMMTGDYPETAKNIAQQIGLHLTDGIITGHELHQMSDEELQARIQQVNIFARIVPEQKLRLVKALQALGEVVAMTGDGVNDAPALKAAEIGIAMGSRGTDVARESSSLVLLEDDFFSIIQAIQLGRRIFDNIKKSIAYIVAIHVSIAGLSLLPVLFGWPLIFFPAHIVFLELIIDPACSIAFEAEPAERNIMRRPPRDPHKPLFDGRILKLSLLQGLGVLGVLLAVFFVLRYLGYSDSHARAFTFATLVLMNIGLIIANRSWAQGIINTMSIPNRALWWIIGGTILLLLAVLYVPFMRHLFYFSLLNPLELAMCFGIALISIAGLKRLILI